MREKNEVEKKILRVILWIYILFCVLVAGLNFGLAPSASLEVKKIITFIWLFYENGFKTIMIIVASILTMRILDSSGVSKLRKRNLKAFMAIALIVHVILPIIYNNYDIYYFVMPLPWSSAPIQLLDTSSHFYHKFVSAWGLTGVSISLIVYAIFSFIVFIGTVLFGRRLQCSNLCLLNGFIAEIFAPVIPLIGRKKSVNKNQLFVLNVMKWIFLALGIMFSLIWIFRVNNTSFIAGLETFKYITFEVFMTMFFWVAFIGRAYCYYCPLGTVVGFVGKASGQSIVTDNTKCISCNKCNNVCPMTIDIKSKAEARSPVTNMTCVGCGHCVDICPTETLSYTTKFISYINNKRGKI